MARLYVPNSIFYLHDLIVNISEKNFVDKKIFSYE